MSKKLSSVLVLVGAISLFLIIIILASWLVYSHKIKLAKRTNDSTVNLKQSNNYPKVEIFQVPILMYHYIRDASGEDELGKNLSVSPENFDAQMRWLKDNDFETVKVSDLADTERVALSRVNGEGKMPIVLTFDDGYTDAYKEAFPVLKKYGFTADFFIIMSYPDKKDGYMTWDQINSLKKANMEIGAHTLTHPDLTDLDSDKAWPQITDSKDDTEVFCYPSGKYNDRIKDLVKEANYVAAVTTKPGVATEKTKLFDLPRIRIENISVEEFASIINHALKND